MATLTFHHLCQSLKKTGAAAVMRGQAETEEDDNYCEFSSVTVRGSPSQPHVRRVL